MTCMVSSVSKIFASEIQGKGSKSVTKNNDLALIAYYAAVNCYLTEQGCRNIDGEVEDELVEALFFSETHYLECANALLELRG